MISRASCVLSVLACMALACGPKDAPRTGAASASASAAPSASASASPSASPSASASSSAFADDGRRILADALAARKKARSEACASSCCLQDHPGYGVPRSTLEPAHALLQSPDADARALALQWIAEAGDPSDSAAVNLLRADPAEVFLPRSHASQAFQRCYELTWESTTVGAVAKETSHSLSQYWARHPEALSRLDREALFEMVEKRNESTSADAYAFVCTQADKLFAPRAGDEAARMSAVLEKERAAPGADRTFEILATVCAATFLDGPALAALLRSGYDRTRGAPIAAEMARRSFSESGVRVRTIFQDPETSFVVREAIVTGIGARGPSAKRDLKATVKGAPRDWLREIARAFVDAVGSVEPRFAAADVRATVQPRLMKSATKDERAAEETRYATAVDTAVERALAALAIP